MDLAGQYLLHPGTRPGIVGARPVMGGARLGRLLRGQAGEGAVQLLGQLLALCAHAQRRTARLALQAAQQQTPVDVAPAASRLLELETARDHLRGMALDWPRHQPGVAAHPAMLDWLAQCPMPLSTPAAGLQPGQVSEQQAQLRAWLESAILCMPVDPWLLEYRDEDAFAAWCAHAAERATPLRCLAAWSPLARSLRPATRTLDLLDANATRQDAQLRAVAQDLRGNPDFAQRPQWMGACAESGAWSRVRQRQVPGPGYSAWSRLHARWIELLELARGPAEPQLRLLDSGALPLGDGQAIAWCEMARGLLLHWVALDAQHRVQDYRVLAPTEWNFHPEGALARAVARLEPHDATSAWCLAIAYDPCVDCNVVVPENLHA